MALNPSGQISLAGSTAGESIATELSLGATTQISLDDTVVRTLAAVPAGQIQMPTDFWGKSSYVATPSYALRLNYTLPINPSSLVLNTFLGLTYFNYTTYYYNSNTDFGTSFTVSNSYSDPNYAPQESNFMVYDSDVTFKWGLENTQLKASPSGSSILAYSSYNNTNILVLTAHYIGAPPSTGKPFVHNLHNYTPTGTLNWVYSYGFSPTVLGYLVPYANDNSDNIYLAGSTSASDDAVVAKMDSSGNILWSRIYGNNVTTSPDNGFNQVAVTPTYIYAKGYSGPLFYTQQIVKYDHSGTFQAAYQIARTSPTRAQPSAFPITEKDGYFYTMVTSSDPVYAGRWPVLFKIDSSFNKVWARQMSGGSNDVTTGGFMVDPSNNVYVALAPSSPGVNTTFEPTIFKYNSSGVLQYQKRLINNVKAAYANRISFSQDKNSIRFDLRYEPGATPLTNNTEKLLIEAQVSDIDNDTLSIATHIGTWVVAPGTRWTDSDETIWAVSPTTQFSDLGSSPYGKTNPAPTDGLLSYTSTQTYSFTKYT